ncbi:NUDIX hydrolase [Flavobacterium sp.]|jgi:8-oxo-dGTP pyrophosphatase MutT (NUDIX family)|uniref:NUDIX hydrolase n=1 Tax=Flavobacterium sp. TaxID=239 RepID=UPI0037C0AE0C
MEFIHFINNLANLKKEKLLATDAHIKMAPLERITYLKDKSYTENVPKNAAVLLLVYPKNHIAHLALIVRNTYPGVHSSQISFPGGKAELQDKTLEITALRETEEEVGVPMNKVKIIRQCSEIYIPPSNFLVTPYLGFSKENLQFVPNPEEVQRVLELPIHQLLDDETIVNTKMTTSYATDIDVPAFQVENFLIWGATAMILSELKELFKNAMK